MQSKVSNNTTVNIGPDDYRRARKIKPKTGLSMRKFVGAAIHGWQFLTPEQKLAAIERRPLEPAQS
jgi:hypothetical protein